MVVGGVGVGSYCAVTEVIGVGAGVGNQGKSGWKYDGPLGVGDGDAVTPEGSV